MELLHQPTYRLNIFLFLAFLGLALQLGATLPDVYPVHFDLSGEPTRWEERGLGMWVLLVAIGAISFGQLHVFQRYVVTNLDMTLLNVPHKKAFLELPLERRLPVARRLNRMLGMLNTSLLVTFSAILLLTWWSAHQPGGWQVRVSQWTLWLAVGFAGVYPLVEVVLTGRVIRRKLREHGLLDR
jgi:uncharacterized membrane protein